MEVARTLSSQNPGLSESCLSFSILARRFSTSKKPPYPGTAGPHIRYFFLCHSGANIVESYYVLSRISTVSFRCVTLLYYNNSIRQMLQ